MFTIHKYILIFLLNTEGDIRAFISYYKGNFPNATVFPKLHMLEAHTVPWLRRWGVGFGMMGEQGAENIHRWFNTQKRTFSNIADRVQQLSCIMREHFIHVAPTNVALEEKENEKGHFIWSLSVVN